MSVINWDAEIRKAKMFMTNAYCMKYISMAEQILAERNKFRAALLDIGGTDTGHKCKCYCATNLIEYAQEEVKE